MKIFPILKLVNFHLNDHCKHLRFSTWWAAISMTSVWVWVWARVSSGIWVIVRSGTCDGVIIGIIASLFLVLIIGLISFLIELCLVNILICKLKITFGILVVVNDVLERWSGRCDVVDKLLSIVSAAGIPIIFCCDCDFYCCCRCGCRCCCHLGFGFVQNVDAWCWWQKKG